PRQSAGNWGSQLGGAVLGEVVRDSGTGNRAIDRVLVGVATEVGRNAGRAVFQSPYGEQTGAQQQRVYGQQQYQQQQRGYVPMTSNDVDQMDTMALRAAFSYERLQAATAGRNMSSAQFRSISGPFETDVANFKSTYRMLSREGKDMRPWDNMSRALSARVGTVSISHLQSEGSVMLSRLQRQGGPGYVDVPQVQTLDGLRQQVGQAPHPYAQPHPYGQQQQQYRVAPDGGVVRYEQAPTSFFDQPGG
ncbi:MAG: hypothetical protein K2W33_02835, partial [Burkholderiales bacterium]|nr:hypothetical protein [Burkholderiales bacterium]